MVFLIYVFGPFVMPRLLCIGNSHAVITIKCDSFVNTQNDFKVFKELAEPTASLETSATITYSTSIVELAVQPCFTFLHNRASSK